MLIGELVPFAYQYLRDNPAAPERHIYGHVLVDEYQDLNKAEQEVAILLAANGHLAIVGDDDQSIYTFKNAHRLGIIDFPTTHPGTHEHTMDECQRCPALVVSMANSLISQNVSRSQPHRSLRARAANGQGVVEVFHFVRHADEIAHLSAKIRDLVANGMPPGQIIVLCQSRKYVRGLFDSLREADLPSEFCYQESQLDEEVATERMAILTLAGDRDDRVGLRYLVGFGSADWRRNQWARVRLLSENEGKSPWQILSEIADDVKIEPSCRRIVARFRIIRGQILALRDLAGIQLVNAWLPNPAECVDLHGLANAAMAENPELSAGNLAAAIRETVIQPEIPDTVTDIRIMSLHKSKGLSANVVFVAGCVEGLIPRTPDVTLTDAQRAEAIEEARRLFFVGITRVKAAPGEGRPGHLILSASRLVPTAIAMQSGVACRPAGGGNMSTTTSRFMRELGPTCPAATTPP
jgi:superfamily I DNA/RNA helicase